MTTLLELSIEEEVLSKISRNSETIDNSEVLELPNKSSRKKAVCLAFKKASGCFLVPSTQAGPV